MRIDDETWETALTLEGADILLAIGREEAERCYNGIGADWMGAELTRLLADLLPVAAPAAVVHDAEYSHRTPRGLASFRAANRRFAANVESEARRLLQGSPRALKAAVRAARASRLALNAAGWPAWRAAWRENAQ